MCIPIKLCSQCSSRTLQRAREFSYSVCSFQEKYSFKRQTDRHQPDAMTIFTKSGVVSKLTRLCTTMGIVMVQLQRVASEAVVCERKLISMHIW